MHNMLIVDDEYLVREGIRKTIDWEEHNIVITHEAKHGKEALEVVKNHPIDIIISDIRMPVMDGLELIRQLADLDADLVVVVLSGYKDFEYAKGSLESGAFSYLLKPIDNEELVNTVKKAAQTLEARRQKADFDETIASELTTLKDKFLIDTLEGRTDLYAYRKKCRMYDLPPIESGFIAHITKESGGPDDSDVLERFHAILETILEDARITRYSVKTDRAGIFVHENGTYEQIETCYKEAISAYEQERNETLDIGLSAFFPSFSYLNKRYLEAMSNAKNKPFPLLNQVSGPNQALDVKPQVKEALIHISRHYHENITVKNVAEALYVSESYLMHAFKDNLGYTFNEYLTAYRLMKAKELLLNTNHHVYEIATMVGYGDVKYFSQVFRKHTGMTPSEFTRKRRP